MRGADLGKVRFSNTDVFDLLVDPYVRFGESVPRVHSLLVYEHFKETRWPNRPEDWISARCTKAGGKDAKPDERLDLLYRFARISMRQYAIRSEPELNDPAARKIIKSRLWPDLRRLLEKYDRLELTGNTAAGPRSDWFHLVAGAEFLYPESATLESTRAVLEELNAVP